jgi:DNA polymerase I
MVEIEGVRVIDQLGDVISEVSRLRGAGVDVGYDIETVDVVPLQSKMVALQFKPKGKKATIIDVRHWFGDDLRMLGTVLEPLFDGAVTLIGHNLKFDLEFALAQLGIEATCVYDTMLAEQIVLGMGMSSAAEKGIHFGMADLAERYDVAVEKESRNWFIYLDKRPEWDDPFPPEQIKYMRQDVAVIHKFKEKQQERIEEWGLGGVIDLEMRALLALVGIEIWGVQINRDGWLSVIDRVEARMHELEAVLHLGNATFEGLDVHVLKVRNEKYMEKWLPYQDWMKARDAYMATRKAEWGKQPGWGEAKKHYLEEWYATHGKMAKPPASKAGVNLGSWMQVRDGFNDLGIPVTSVNKDELALYVDKHPLVQVYLDYGEARKLVTVYGRERGKKEKAFIELLDERDRLRASYQQIGADTGRMSSYSPNFQQIPADGLGAELRKNVVAAPGYTLVVADFSNIELRIIAELSGDKFLLGAFSSGEDIHAYTARVMFNLSDEQATKKWTDSHNVVIGGKEIENTSYRKVAKTINYMLLYGAGVKRLASMLRIPEKDARTLLDLYYKTFASAIAWLNEQKSRLNQAEAAGKSSVYAETRSGRRRWFNIPKKPKQIGRGKQATVEEVREWQEAMDKWNEMRAAIRRQLANTPIQGLSADITKLAASLWQERVGSRNARMHLEAVIHDEFIIEASPEMAETAARILEEVMTEAMQTYLHKVDLGEVHAVITPYWEH